MAPGEAARRPACPWWLTHEAEEVFLKKVAKLKNSLVLYDPQLKLHPTGFCNKETEASFAEYFWLTLPVNCQVMFVAIGVVTCTYWSAQLLYHVVTGEIAWSTSGCDLLALAWYAPNTYCFSKRPIPSLFKRVFSFAFRSAMIFMPIVFIAQGCGSDPVYGLQHLLLLATIGTWTCPYFLHHALNMVGVAFVPIIWSLVTGTPSPTMSHLELTCVSAMVLCCGVLFSSALCTYRRQEWFRRKAGRSRDRKSRSPRSGRSCSSTRSSISRSPSSLPRVEEHEQRYRDVQCGFNDGVVPLREAYHVGSAEADKMRNTAEWVQRSIRWLRAEQEEAARDVVVWGVDCSSGADTVGGRPDCGDARSDSPLAGSHKRPHPVRCRAGDRSSVK